MNTMMTATDVIVRLADARDVPASAACFPDAGASSLHERLPRMAAAGHLWVVEGDGRAGIVGTLGFDDAACRGSLFVQMMGVRADRRRSGVATALFLHAAAFARRRGFRRMVADIPTHNAAI